jgi:hypothetical protein
MDPTILSGELWWTAANAFFGAGLGASFYVLLKTQPYLVNRSYDPKYNAAYISRFITGVIGGVILAIALGPALGKQLGSGAGATLTPGVLAILGGYAAEAVETILQRLVEVLLALVRGDGSAQVQAKATAEQAEKSATLQGLLPELEAASARRDDAKFNESLQKIRAALK